MNESASENLDGPTSILIIHFHSTMNAGDAVQLEEAIADLRNNFANSRITVSANFPLEVHLKSLDVDVVPSIRSWIGLGKDRSANQQRINFIRAFYKILRGCSSSKYNADQSAEADEWESIITAYKQSDLVISTPGNIFLSMGRLGFPFLCSVLAILPALCFRKPFFVMPQSIGPLHRWWERLMVKQLYSRAKLVFLRDPKSLRLAKKIGLPTGRLKLTHDQSMLSSVKKPEDPPPQLIQAGFHQGQLAIGVTVISKLLRTISSQSLSAYYRILAKSLSEFVNQYQAKVYFFPQVTGPEKHEDDRHASRRVVEMMTCPIDRIVLFENVLSAQALRASYSWMDLFIASRLHSAIFSMSAGVPTLMIGYMDKTAGVAEMFEWSDYFIELNRLEENGLWETLEDMYEKRIALKTTLIKRFTQITAESTSPAQLIHEAFMHDGS